MIDLILKKATIIEVVCSFLLFWIIPFGIPFLIGIIGYIGYVQYTYSKLQKSSKLSNTQMEGAVYSQKSFLDFLKIPLPKIRPNEVLIKVVAGAINPCDYKLIPTNVPFLRWLYFNDNGIGRDFSGIIVDVGENIKSFKIGDKVFGRARRGVLQEYTTAKEDDIVIKPSNISFEEVASLPLAALTSYQSLTWFDKNIEGKDILIIGASGGTGNFAVQIARYLKANEVYGVCSSKNAEFVKGLGASDVIEYDKENCLKKIEGKKFDLIFDAVSSPEDPEQYPVYSSYLKDDGKWVAINSPKRLKLLKGTLCAYFLGKNCFLEPKNHHWHFLVYNKKDTEFLKKMVEEGKIKSQFETFKFNKEGVLDAFQKLKGRRVRGKLVIKVSEAEESS